MSIDPFAGFSQPMLTSMAQWSSAAAPPAGGTEGEPQQPQNPFQSPPKVSGSQAMPPVLPASLQRAFSNPFEFSPTSSSNPFSPRKAASFRVDQFSGLRGHIPFGEAVEFVEMPHHGRSKSYTAPSNTEKFSENNSLPSYTTPSTPAHFDFAATDAFISTNPFSPVRGSSRGPVNVFAETTAPHASTLTPTAPLAQLASEGFAPSLSFYDFSSVQGVRPNAAPINVISAAEVLGARFHPFDATSSVSNETLVQSLSFAPAVPPDEHAISSTGPSTFNGTIPPLEQTYGAAAFKVHPAFDPFAPVQSQAVAPAPTVPAPTPTVSAPTPTSSAARKDDFMEIFSSSWAAKPPPPAPATTSQSPAVSQKLARRQSMQLAKRRPSEVFREEKEITAIEDVQEDEDDAEGDDDDVTIVDTLAPQVRPPKDLDPSKLKEWLVIGDIYIVTYEMDTQLGMLLERKDELAQRDQKRMERAMVKMVVSGGASDVKGVTAGSKIVSVDSVSMLGRSYLEILNIIRGAARPLKIEFERTVLQEADEDIHGYCLVQRGRAPLAPLKYAKWKRMYYVLGGQIASHNVLQLYKNRQEYEDAVIALFRHEELPVKVKAYRLSMQYKTSNLKTKNYKEENEVVKFFVLKPPNATFKCIKIGYTEMEGLRKLHSQICRYTTGG